MHIKLMITCKYHSGNWKWLLYCDKFGIADVFIGSPKTDSKDNVKLEALKHVRSHVKRHIDELDLQIKDRESDGSQLHVDLNDIN